MPDFGAPVATGINVSPNTGLQTLSQLLSIQGQKQGLAGQAAEVQQAQQTARQRSGIASFMSSFDPTKHVGPDGTLDLDQVLTDPQLRQAAGDQFPALMQQMVQIKQSQLQAKQQLVNLNDSTRNQFLGLLGGLRTDPDVLKDEPGPNGAAGAGRQKVQQTIGQFAATGPDAARIAQIYGGVLDHVPPGKLAQTLSNFQLQAQDAATQAGRQAPSLVSTGTSLVNVNPQAAGGDVSKPVGPLKITPSPTGQIIEDSVGHQFRYDQSTNTLIPVGAGVGGGGGSPRPAAPAAPNALPQQPSGPKFTQATPGQPEIQADVDAARKAGDQVGLNRDINQRILALNKQATTGPGTDFLHQAAAAVGLPGGASYQELGAFLDRQAALASHTMGLPETNAGLGAAQQFTGNTKLNNQVIADKTKFVDALNTAAGAYRAGLDRHVGTGTNPNYAAYQPFRSAWAQNFDPEVFAYENAVRNGDKEEQEAIEKSEGQKGMAALLKKRTALMSLINGQ